MDAEQKIALLHFQAAHLRLWKEKQAADFSADLARARAEIGRLRTALYTLLSSRSWRLTEPIRRFSAFIKSHAKRRQVEAPDWAHTSKPANTEEPRPNFERTVVPTTTAYLTQGRAAWDEFGRRRLAEFLDSGQSIIFPLEASPQVTIVLVLHNQAHLSLLSLLSVKDNADVSYEVVIVDNGSNDQTAAVLARIENATIIGNQENTGFSPGCMQAASKSRGKYLFFLNNDALLDPNSLRPALANFERDSTVGAVGGRILLPDGSLQEAGAILWCDGTTNGYGRDDHPEKLQYRFRRPVDYCSGACLLTPRRLFQDLDGFDQIFAPGYYEDLDYSMRLRANGFCSVYEPLSTVRHYENASSANKGAALTHVIAHHQTFWERWREALARHYEPCGENISRARIAASDERTRILFIMSQVPHQEPGGSYSRSWKLLNQLACEGFVTCAATKVSPTESDYADIPREVELLDATAETELVLRQNVNEYDVLWVLGEVNLGRLAVALNGIDQVTSTIVADLTANDAELPLRLLEQGKPSQEFKSVLQRDLSIPCNGKDETARGIALPIQTVPIWTLK